MLKNSPGEDATSNAAEKVDEELSRLADLYKALRSHDLLECLPAEDPNLSPLFTPYTKEGTCSWCGYVFSSFELILNSEYLYNL